MVRIDFTRTPIRQEICPDHFAIQQGGWKSYQEELLSPLRTIPQNADQRLHVSLGLARMFLIAFTLGRIHAVTARYAFSMDPSVRERLHSQLP